MHQHKQCDSYRIDSKILKTFNLQKKQEIQENEHLNDKFKEFNLEKITYSNISTILFEVVLLKMHTSVCYRMKIISICMIPGIVCPENSIWQTHGSPNNEKH